LRVWRLAPRSNVAVEVQGIRLVATFLVLAGDGQRPLGEGVCLLRAARQYMCLSQGEATGHLKCYSSCCNSLCQGLRKQRHGISVALAEGICRAQGCGHEGQIDWEVCVLTD